MGSRRTPGGSTGGGAAALAAGLTPLEFGSDIGGSIRVPAAFCGVFGHRPSETAMPRSGQFPMPPMPNAAVVMGVQGPLARSADDLELALDVAAGRRSRRGRRLAPDDPGGAPRPPGGLSRRGLAPDSLAAARRGDRRRARGSRLPARPPRLPRRRPRSPTRSAITASTTRSTSRSLAAVTSARVPADAASRAPRGHAHARRRMEPCAPARDRERRAGLCRVGRAARAVPRRLARVLPRVGRAPDARILHAGLSALGQAVARYARFHRQDARR